jgi:hypothetical protein
MFLALQKRNGSYLSTLRGAVRRKRLSGYERRRRCHSARYDCLLPLFYGSEEASAPYRGTPCGKQTSFRSKPRKSPFATSHLISTLDALHTALQYWLNKLVTLRRFRFSAANTHRPANIEILVSRLQLSRGANRLFGAKGVTFLAQPRGNRSK